MFNALTSADPLAQVGPVHMLPTAAADMTPPPPRDPTERKLVYDPAEHAQALWAPSFAAADPERLSVLLEGLYGEPLLASAMVNVPLTIVDAATAPAEDTDERGEVESWVSTLLITSDGRVVRSGSIFVFSALSVWVRRWGPPPWDPPMRALIRQRPSRRNPERRVLYLVFLPETESESQARAKKGGRP